MKGQKPKLDNVIPMRGNTGRPVPPAPSLLSEGGKKVWDRLAPEMIRQGRLEPHFEDLFGAVCEGANDVIELSSTLAMEEDKYDPLLSAVFWREVLEIDFCGEFEARQ